jgi:hypothetical protein
MSFRDKTLIVDAVLNESLKIEEEKEFTKNI